MLDRNYGIGFYGINEATVPKRLLEDQRAGEIVAGPSSDGWTASNRTLKT